MIFFFHESATFHGGWTHRVYLYICFSHCSWGVLQYANKLKIKKSNACYRSDKLLKLLNARVYVNTHIGRNTAKDEKRGKITAVYHLDICTFYSVFPSVLWYRLEFEPILVLMLNRYRSTRDRIGPICLCGFDADSPVIGGGGISPLVVHLNGSACACAWRMSVQCTWPARHVWVEWGVCWVWGNILATDRLAGHWMQALHDVTQYTMPCITLK